MIFNFILSWVWPE